MASLCTLDELYKGLKRDNDHLAAYKAIRAESTASFATGSYSDAANFMDLPNDLILDIVQKLDPRSFASLRTTCKFMHLFLSGHSCEMGTSLYTWQQAALHFCMKRESDAASIRGGIIADEPGLGKTISMIALVIQTLGRLPVRPPEAILTTDSGGRPVAVLVEQSAAQPEENVKRSHRIQSKGASHALPEIQPALGDVKRALQSVAPPGGRVGLRRLGRYRCCLSCGMPRVVFDLAPAADAAFFCHQLRGASCATPFSHFGAEPPLGYWPAAAESTVHPDLPSVPSSPSPSPTTSFHHHRIGAALHPLAERNAQFFLELRLRYGASHVDRLLMWLALRTFRGGPTSFADLTATAMGSLFAAVVRSTALQPPYRLLSESESNTYGLPQALGGGSGGTGPHTFRLEDLQLRSGDVAEDFTPEKRRAMEQCLRALGFQPVERARAVVWRAGSDVDPFLLDGYAILRALVAEGVPSQGIRVTVYMPTTLIVVPEVTKKQWRAQLDTFQGPAKFTWQDVRETADGFPTEITADIVLAAIEEFSQSIAKKDATRWMAQTHFLRIILDEGHLLQNSTQSLKVRNLLALRAQSRWIMTGTPTRVNKDGTVAALDKFFALVDFLRIPPYAGNAKLWKRRVADPYARGDARGMEALLAVLGPNMIRATIAECLPDLIKVVPKVIEVELSPLAAQHHNLRVEMILKNLLTAEDQHHVDSFLNVRNTKYANLVKGEIKASAFMDQVFESVLAPNENIIELLVLLALRLGETFHDPASAQRIVRELFSACDGAEPASAVLHQLLEDGTPYLPTRELRAPEMLLLPETAAGAAPRDPRPGDDASSDLLTLPIRIRKEEDCEEEDAEMGPDSRGVGAQAAAAREGGGTPGVMDVAGPSTAAAAAANAVPESERRMETKASKYRRKEVYPNPRQDLVNFTDALSRPDEPIAEKLIQVERALRKGGICQRPGCGHATHVPIIGPGCGCITCVFCLLARATEDPKGELRSCPACAMPYRMEPKEARSPWENPHPTRDVPRDLIDLQCAFMRGPGTFNQLHPHDRISRELLKIPLSDRIRASNRAVYSEPIAKVAQLIDLLAARSLTDPRICGAAFPEQLAHEARVSTPGFPLHRAARMPAPNSDPAHGQSQPQHTAGEDGHRDAFACGPWLHWRGALRHLLGTVRAEALVRMYEPGSKRKAIVYFGPQPADIAVDYPIIDLTRWWLDNTGARFVELINRPPKAYFTLKGQYGETAKNVKNIVWRPEGVPEEATAAAAERSGPETDVQPDAKGKQRSSTRNEALDLFRDPSSGVNVLLLDEAGAVGLDLSFVTDMIMMEPLESLDVEKQVIARAVRMGRPEHLPFELNILVAKGTVEKTIFDLRGGGGQPVGDAAESGTGGRGDGLFDESAHLSPQERLEWRRRNEIFLALSKTKPLGLKAKNQECVQDP